MTFTELVSAVLDNFGNPDDAGDLETLIGEKINFVITEDLHSKGLPYYDTTATFSTVASQEYVAVPTGYARAQNIFIKGSSDTDYDKPLGVFPIPEARYQTTGRPTKARVMYNATLAALGIHFRPIPDAVYSGLVYYQRKETSISGSQSSILSSIYGDMPIIAGATYWAALTLGRDIVDRWDREYNRAIGVMCEWFRTRSGEDYMEPNLYGNHEDNGLIDKYNP